MAQLIKINDTTVAKIGTQEVKQVYGKTELVKRREYLVEELAEVDSLLALIP